MTQILNLPLSSLQIARPETLEAVNTFAPAHRAEEGDVVGVSSDFRMSSGSSLPDRTVTTAWTVSNGRFMTTAVSQIAQHVRMNAAMAFALLSEDQQALVPVITTAQRRPAADEAINLRLLLVPGGAIVHSVIADLAVGRRTGRDAQAHLDATMRVFLQDGLSAHLQIDAVASLAAAVSDLATWGTVWRHMAGTDGAPPSRCKVNLTPV